MARPPVYSTRFKVFAVFMLAVAVAAFVGAVLASTSGDDNEAPILSAGGEDVVESLIPARDSQVPQQTTVGIDLLVGWVGTLVVNGTEVPEDQLDVTPELALIQFTPGDGRAVEQLRGGRNCVEAIVWPLSEGRESGERRVSWCFTVV
jgi:hypothetical protein